MKTNKNNKSKNEYRFSTDSGSMLDGISSGEASDGEMGLLSDDGNSNNENIGKGKGIAKD